MKTPLKLLAIIMVATVPPDAMAQYLTAAGSKTEFADLGDKKIAYRSIGKGSPIVLVNRFRGTLDTWDPLFLDMLAETHQVITFDYPGIGYSTGTLPTDISLVAKDVKAFVAALRLKKLDVIGWSYGGLVAQAFMLSYPEIVNHAILLGTGPPGERPVPLEQAFLDAALKPVNSFEDEVVLFFEPKSEASRKAAKLSHDRISKRLDVSKIPAIPEIFESYFQGGRGFVLDKEGYREKLKVTKIPILIISGDHDISFAVENWYPLTRQLPTSQLIVLPQTGHGPQHEHIKLLIGYVENFLKNSN